MGKRDKRILAKRRQKNYTTLPQHKQTGKILNPPLLAIPGMRNSSWINDRLPELLWCSLLVIRLEREVALRIFRHVAKCVEGKFEPNKGIDIGHSGLAELPEELSSKIVGVVCSTPEAREALRPLLLLSDLPLRDQWLRGIALNPLESDWNVLRVGVAHVFDHQSQEATDCRWLRILVMVMSGQMHLQTGEQVKQILNYPDEGDQRQVRPLIRAMEITMSSAPIATRRTWPEGFWKQCWQETPCIPHGLSVEPSQSAAGTTIQKVEETSDSLTTHATKTVTSTAVDARHDTAFGIAAYALGILSELMRIGAPTTIVARLGLRALLEAYITLSYLAKQDKPETWQTYRDYGAGQAKLAFLKLDDEEMRKVGFVDGSALSEIANEDKSLDFVPINLGHWESTNLRQMSEKADLKGQYDRFYPWTSAYMHANWGAVRSVSFDVCINALHRGHTVLRDAPATLNDVIADACELTDEILSVVDCLYPVLPSREGLA